MVQVRRFAESIGSMPAKVGMKLATLDYTISDINSFLPDVVEITLIGAPRGAASQLRYSDSLYIDEVDARNNWGFPVCAGAIEFGSFDRNRRGFTSGLSEGFA